MFFNLGETFDVHYTPYFFRIMNGGAQKVFATMEYASFTFKDDVNDHKLQVNLDGIGPKSFNYYLDGNWHHIAFVLDINTTLRIEVLKKYIDGLFLGSDFESIAYYPLPANLNSIDIDDIKLSQANSYNQFFGGMDELAIYYEARTPQQIYSDYNDVFNLHKAYTLGQLTPQIPLPDLEGNLDPAEYPLNYAPVSSGGDYSNVNTALDQIIDFPLPRFKPNHTLRRNVNFFKSADLLHNEYNNDKPTQIATSVDIKLELARNWNYYFTVLENLGDAKLPELETGTFAAAWVDAANINTDLPLAVLSYLSPPGTNNPYNLTEPYITSDDLDGSCPGGQLHYIYKDDNGYPSSIHRAREGSNPWSISKLQTGIYTPDGDAMKDHFEVLYGNTTPPPDHFLAINRKISMMAEDNENLLDYNDNIYSDIINPSIQSNQYLRDEYSTYLTSTDNFHKIQGEAKAEIDRQFRFNATANSSLFAPDFIFTNYGNDGHDKFRHFYPQLRRINSEIDGHPYSTPDIYFSSPKLWFQNANGPRHAWRWLSQCRYNEISATYTALDGTPIAAFDDQRFAPYVSPGYETEKEESAMRPAQYLGILKAMMLTGVDYFHIGYYMKGDADNIPGGNGRSFAWRSSTPVYAQAIGSHCEEFLTDGTLLPGDVSLVLNLPGNRPNYTFNGGNPNELIVVRQGNTPNDKLEDQITNTNGAEVIKPLRPLMNYHQEFIPELFQQCMELPHALSLLYPK